MFQALGYTNASLAGVYAFVAEIFSGLPLTAPGTSGASGTPAPSSGGTGSTPASFPIVARFFADGGGMLTVDSFAQTSALPGPTVDRGLHRQSGLHWNGDADLEQWCD
jgi:hypothetical protein